VVDENRANILVEAPRPSRTSAAPAKRPAADQVP
jgi:hypothetical protein